MVAAARVIVAAWEHASPLTDLAAVAAEALESAQLLQDPETAARAAKLQSLLDQRTAQVASMTAQVRGLGADISALRARVAELEALTPAPIQTCQVCKAGYAYGQSCGNCEFKARMAADIEERGDAS